MFHLSSLAYLKQFVNNRVTVNHSEQHSIEWIECCPHRGSTVLCVYSTAFLCISIGLKQYVWFLLYIMRKLSFRRNSIHSFTVLSWMYPARFFILSPINSIWIVKFSSIIINHCMEMNNQRVCMEHEYNIRSRVICPCCTQNNKFYYFTEW